VANNCYPYTFLPARLTAKQSGSVFIMQGHHVAAMTIHWWGNEGTRCEASIIGLSRLSTVNLLIKIACVATKLSNISNLKMSWSTPVWTRRSTVLSLPFQWGFPGLCVKFSTTVLPGQTIKKVSGQQLSS